MDQEVFEFPDEKEAKVAVEVQAGPEFEIEIEDDTPPKDRNRQPVSEEEVKKLKLDADELDQYSVEAKDKLIKMKKVWHDERRAKEAADRERQEAIRIATKLAEENKQLK